MKIYYTFKHLEKMVQDLFKKNYKTPNKNLKIYISKWRAFPYSWIARFYITKL